jgi:hypothetical protein
MCKNIIRIISNLLSLCIVLLSGCASPVEENEDLPAVLLESQTVQANTPKQINDIYTSRNKKLIIDAEVEISDLKNLAEVTLSLDESSLQELVDDIVFTEYPNAIEDTGESGERRWCYFENRKPLVELNVNDNGFVSYLNYTKDLSVSMIDGEHLFEYGYITKIMPPQMTITAEEANEVSASLLSMYSCLSYKSFNILAEGSTENSSTSGCYYLLLQAFYEGIPISTKHETNETGVLAGALVSNDGLFQFYGTIPLKVVESKTIEQSIALDSTIAKLKSSFADFALGETINVNRIAFEYFPLSNKNGSISLRPVWSFYCTDTRTKLENSEISAGLSEVATKYISIYFADDGSFCGLYY